MSHTGQSPRRLPRIGMRNIKTAVAAALCALIYHFLNRNPAFACIGAVFGMGSDLESSKLHGGNRLFGTAIGGLLAMALFRVYLIFCPEGNKTLLLVPLIFLGTIVLIWLCLIFWVGGVQPGGVVLCIVLFSTPVDQYISYALNRIFDTGIGVLMALLVNSMLPGGFTFGFMRRFYERLGIRMDRFQEEPEFPGEERRRGGDRRQTGDRRQGGDRRQNGDRRQAGDRRRGEDRRQTGGDGGPEAEPPEGGPNRDPAVSPPESTQSGSPLSSSR